jgi:hypothetical protein
MKTRTCIFAAYWTGYLALQCRIFGGMRLDYFDAYHNLQNARQLAGADVGYQAFRPPLVPLLHAPLQKLLDLLGAGLGSRICAPHLLQCALTMACLFCVYRYLRLFFPPAWAHLGTVLMSMNRMTIHYFGFVLGDIPSALFLVLFLSLQSPRHPAEKGRPLLSSLALLACLLSRWNMPMAPFLLLGAGSAAWIWHGRPRPQRAALGRLALICALGLSGWVAVYVALYQHVYGFGWIASVRLFAGALHIAYQTQGVSQSFLTYAEGLLISAGPVAALAALNGLWLALKDPREELFLHGIFFLAFVAVLNFGIGHKEFRYLYTVLPLFYGLVVAGLRGWQEKLRSPRLAAARFLGAGVLLASVLAGASQEWLNFRDPIYRDTMQLDLVRAIRAHSGKQTRLFWTGTAYAMLPQEHQLSPRDAFYYIYHVPCAGSLAYLAGQPVYHIRLEMLKNKPALPLSRRDADLGDLREGDLVITAPARFYVNAAPLGPDLNSLGLHIWTQGALKKVAELPAGRRSLNHEPA